MGCVRAVRDETLTSKYIESSLHKVHPSLLHATHTIVIRRQSVFHAYYLVALGAHKLVYLGYFGATFLSRTGQLLGYLHPLALSGLVDGEGLLGGEIRVGFQHCSAERALNDLFVVFLDFLATVIFDAVVVVAEDAIAVLATHGHPVDLPALLDLAAFSQLLILHKNSPNYNIRHA